jgi:hypothetical protein
LSDSAAPVVVVLGLLLLGALLAYGVQRIPPTRRPMFEWLGIGLPVAGFSLDVIGEGASHGFLGYTLLSLPVLLAFATARYWFTVRSRP